MTDRYMLAHDLPPGRFNFRAAAIIRRDAHLLIHRATRDPFWCLPGGRVEWGESTRIALAREIEEELGVAATIGELGIVLENFFTLANKRYHELAYYYPVTVPATFPFRTDGEICYRTTDGGIDLEFKWVEPHEHVLERHDFKPEGLRPMLAADEAALRHLVWQDP